MPNFTLTWEIQEEADSPRQAAEQVWKRIFERDTAGPEDACVFEVTDEQTLQKCQIDLSEPAEATVVDAFDHTTKP